MSVQNGHCCVSLTSDNPQGDKAIHRVMIEKRSTIITYAEGKKSDTNQFVTQLRVCLMKHVGSTLEQESQDCLTKSEQQWLDIIP